VIAVYRLHRRDYPVNEGIGAALYGGRWNERGTEAIYTAGTRSLAVLEVLVHYATLLAIS
jgi:RES domain-containing protein